MKSFLGKYLGHLAAYVASSVGILAAIDPALLPPVGKLAVAGAALAVAIGHHGYTAGTLSTAVTAASNALAKIPAVAAILMLAIIAGAGTGLTGCATVQGFFASPASAPIITVAVDVAVAAAEQKGVTAVQINTIAKLALTADSSTGATLATVAAEVNVQIGKLNLPPLDLAAANILEVALTQAIQAKVGNNADLAAAQADVATVLTAVIQATGG